MQKLMFALAGAGLIVLAGCQASAPVKKDEPAVAPKQVEAPVKAEASKAQLTEEAKQALAKAEADVAEADKKKALWTTAQDALKKAKAAAAKGESDEVIKHAKLASEQAALGMEQLKYPPMTLKK